MQIEPPAPERPDTGKMRRRLGYMTTLVIGITIVLLATIAAWIFLWGGGVTRARQVEAAPSSRSTSH